MMNHREMYEACTEALRTFVHGAGFSDVVIGLSGGIDSALVATMAVDALGANCVHGVLLPGPYSSEHSINDARSLAERLGIDAPVISICDTYDAFVRALDLADNHKLSGLAAENTQARCRMTFIMALSNMHDWLMLNTGNKSESMMGYSTLYGDTAGAFAPIGGLYKTDVFACARWRNAWAQETGKIEPIPENTITKPPSAELAPNQEDERSLGIDYATLDAVLVAAIEQEIPAEDIAAKLCLPLERVNCILARVESYAFKRAFEPPFPPAKFYKCTRG